MKTIRYVVVNNRGTPQYTYSDYKKACEMCARMNAAKDPHMIPRKPYSVMKRGEK